MPGQSQAPIPRARISISTHWTELRLAAQASSARLDARAAFETFCRRYWGAVYGVIRARYPEPLARDLTQEFFLTRIIEGDSLPQLRPELGRFRAWLYRTLRHFLIDKWKQRTTRKRDERLQTAFDEQRTAAPELSVDEYERHYAHAIAERAFRALHESWSPRLQRHGANIDQPTLISWLIDRDARVLTGALGISNDNARQTLHRLHVDLWKQLRAVVAETLEDERDLTNELREVCRILHLTPPDEPA